MCQDTETHQHGGRRFRRGGFGRHFGKRGFGGGRMRRGDVRPALLGMLVEEPMHGYQLIQALEERSGGHWRPSPGSVYPTLQLLEDQGLVTSEEVQGRRVYRLTDAGREEAQSLGDAARPWETFAEEGDESIARVRQEGFALVAAARQVVMAGTPEQRAAAAEVLAGARKELYRLLANGGTGEA
jgi:DNA-binding PadR family transcriptional regulator